jgi:hypothetical protein
MMVLILFNNHLFVEFEVVPLMQKIKELIEFEFLVVKQNIKGW